MKNNLLQEDIIYLLITKNIKENLNNEKVDILKLIITFLLKI